MKTTFAGRVIHKECPYVKLLTEPIGQLPMLPEVPTRMKCVAQVNDSLCVVEVTVSVQEVSSEERTLGRATRP